MNILQMQPFSLQPCILCIRTWLTLHGVLVGLHRHLPFPSHLRHLRRFDRRPPVQPDRLGHPLPQLVLPPQPSVRALESARKMEVSAGTKFEDNFYKLDRKMEQETRNSQAVLSLSS